VGSAVFHHLFNFATGCRMQTDHWQQPDSSISNWQTSRLLSLIDFLPVRWHEADLYFPFATIR
jgi:hypothetical protein